MQLPIVDGAQVRPRPPNRRVGTSREIAQYSLRIVLFVGCIIGLHRWSALRLERTAASTELAELLPAIQLGWPEAAELRELAPAGIAEVLTGSEQVLGFAATTSPWADEVVGYSGPNNVLLLLAADQTIVSASLLSSGDTRDHVAVVQAAPEFWKQFVGRPWGSTATWEQTPIDGVSGATLTSLAIAEAIALRTAGERLSLRFPEQPTLEEAQRLTPEVAKLEPIEWYGQAAWQMTSASGASLGMLVRTGNLVDDVEGYQGPTELLCWFDGEQLRNVRLRGSYDNQPYVGYVQQEYSFWPLFKGRSLASLAEIDVEAEHIEGVSGATMTSVAVAQTLQRAAQKLRQQATEGARPAAPQLTKRWNWSLAELATAGLAVLAMGWSRWRGRSRPLPRILWQVSCLVMLGLAAGNLLSLALLAGWTKGGVPFRLAPGLTVLLAVAFIWPMFSKGNVYCDHMCPHGILQQWMIPWRRRAARSWLPQLGAGRLPPAMVLLLRSLSWLGIALGVGWLMFDWPIPLAELEPFDAYVWRVGWSLSGLVWLGSLLLSLWRPMAYCQLACPTGRVLDAMRRSKRQSQAVWIDGGLLLAVVLVWWLPTL